MTPYEAAASTCGAAGASLHSVAGSCPSLVAARVAAWLAESIGAPLHLVKAPTALILQEGAAAGLLIAGAQRKSALLLAVGSRGRSSPVGTLLGPVASAMARTAGTPVLIVPPRADRSHGTLPPSLASETTKSRTLVVGYEGSPAAGRALERPAASPAA